MRLCSTRREMERPRKRGPLVLTAQERAELRKISQSRTETAAAFSGQKYCLGMVRIKLSQRLQGTVV